MRSLGLKLSRVVIDAGHGGHDTGTIGPGGYTEKELVLDVANRLKELIENELGAEVVMTQERRQLRAAREPDRYRQSTAGRPLHIDPRQFEPRPLRSWRGNVLF